MNIDEEEDRISNLPEALLHHVLSFLEMKHVVQTSVLSTKWRYVWKSLPFLNLIQNGPKTWFEVFVNNVLILRRSCSNIQRFRLSCRWHDFDVYNNTWILKALEQNVQELYLNLQDISTDEFECRLPNCLFTCKSLMILDLKADSNSALKINVPDLVSLPNLKTLALSSVLVEGEPNKIFSCCPVLESLSLTYTEFDQTNLNISSPKLKHLVIENLYGEYGDGCSDWEDYRIELDAPNLTSFYIGDLITTNYSIRNLSALVKAEIDMGIEKLDEDGAQQVMKILRAIDNVEDLKLSEEFLEVITGARALLESNHIQFCKLRCLEMQTWLSIDCVNSIIYLLKISPNIESLLVAVYDQDLSDSKPKYPDWDGVRTNAAAIEEFNQEAGVLSQCMLDRLKLVQIQGINWRLNQFLFLEYLLKNAPVLENVVLYASKDQSAHTKSLAKKFIEQLRSLLRASPCITIILL